MLSKPHQGLLFLIAPDLQAHWTRAQAGSGVVFLDHRDAGAA